MVDFNTEKSQLTRLGRVFVDQKIKRSYNNTMTWKLENVNPHLYDDIDDIAMDTVGYLEKQLAEKGIALTDDVSETLYDKIRMAVLDDILVDQ